nr:hypothetical protein [Candidatus Sigynarchaeum springense]
MGQHRGDHYLSVFLQDSSILQRFLAEISGQQVNIVTHNDPDGLLAAAICTRGLIALGVNDDNIDFVFESPGNIQQGKSRFLDPQSDDFIDGIIIVLDLPYTKQAHFWIDHHSSELDVKPSDGTLVVVQDTSKSAAALTYDFFAKTMHVQGKLCDLAFLDFVDARDIGRPPKTISKEYEAILLAILQDRDDYSFFVDVIDMLVDDPDPRPITVDPRVIMKAKKERKQINRGAALLHTLVVEKEKQDFFKQIDIESDKPFGDESKKRVFLYKQFLFLDFSDIDNPEKEKANGAVIPYYIIEPELKKLGLEYFYFLSFRGDDKTGEIHATISINQAKSEAVKAFDVSSFAKKRGGGGHRFVAGFTIPPETFTETISQAMSFFAVE